MERQPTTRMEIEEAIFVEALVQPLEARREFVARQCAQNHVDAPRVLALLDGYQGNSAFLDTPAPTAALQSAGADVPALPPEPGPGDCVGRYRLLERIGEGGFGIVFLAEQQEPVRRRVALKLVRLGLDTREFIARFEQERQALALMEHPNIARVFDAGATAAGRPFLVMELVRGVPITTYCDEHRLSIDARLRLFLRVCSAIQHAHQKGVIHRDLKPSNILVVDGVEPDCSRGRRPRSSGLAPSTGSGQVEAGYSGEPVPKIIDFGIAKAIPTLSGLTDRTAFTRHHALIGTPAYTSPEQLDLGARDVDTRSDIYALGVLLYELLTGHAPFDHAAVGNVGLDELRRMIREVEPPRPSARVAALEPGERARIVGRRGIDTAKLAPLLRGDLDWIALRCLEKDRTRRYATANALAADVQRYLDHEPVAARAPSTAYRLGKFVRRHRLGVAASAAVLTVVVAGSLLTTMQMFRALRAERRQLELSAAALRAEQLAAEARRDAEAQALRLEQARWARETALPEILRLLKGNDIPAAFKLACQVEPFLPDDPVLAGFWPQLSARVTVETTPPGADICVKPYSQPGADWQYLGRSPLQDVRLPRSVHRWRIEKEGHTTVERTDPRWWWNRNDRRLECVLYETAATPAGMVRVQNDPEAEAFRAWRVAEFWIDRCEVTNRDFKEFVARGGYATEKFWKHVFLRDGQPVSWSEAMALFRDRTGQHGPAGWENGTYPETEAEFPVTGISWFEAAAYAEFVGKRLPSVEHWQKAAPRIEAQEILQFANIGGGGLAPVGKHPNLSSWGVADLAGNAKEWCWNEASGGRRLLLGGGWDEPEYMFTAADARSPFERAPNFGFRCIKTDENVRILETVDAPIPPRVVRDYATEEPVNDGQFEFIRRVYAYDRTDLEPQVEHVEENPRRRMEFVSFNAAYDGERMMARLFLPKSARPPYQVIIYLPGTGARRLRSSENPGETQVFEALLDTGRALVLPIYAGTFERQSLGPTAGERGTVEWCVRVMKDLRRTIDYLETRPDEFRADGLAYVGLSWGAEWGPIASALEDRIKVNVFIGGGFGGGKVSSEADPFHFAPRVRVPTLMINGRHDFIFELETSQRPLFRALGPRPEHKKHIHVEGGHVFSGAQVSNAIREWLNAYLGEP